MTRPSDWDCFPVNKIIIVPWLLRKWFSSMIINISHFFLIIGTIKMCLKKIKKGPKLKKMNFGLHNKMEFVEFTLRSSFQIFSSNQNKFQKIPTLIQMYSKHVRKWTVPKWIRNFGISNGLILTKIKIRRRRRFGLSWRKCDWYKKDFLTPFCLYLGMTRGPKQGDQGRFVGQSKND